MARIAVDQGDLARILGKVRGINEAVRGAATIKALNDGAHRARERAIDGIRGELPALQKGTINRRLRLRRAGRGRPAAEILVVAKGINLARFGARQTARGVSVQVKQGRKVVRGAFVARVGSGGVRLVLARVTQGQRKYRGKPQVGRTPLAGLFGPDVLDVLKNHVNRVLEGAGDEITADIQNTIRRVLAAGVA